MAPVKLGQTAGFKEGLPGLGREKRKAKPDIVLPKEEKRPASSDAKVDAIYTILNEFMQKQLAKNEGLDSLLIEIRDLIVDSVIPDLKKIQFDDMPKGPKELDFEVDEFPGGFGL